MTIKFISKTDGPDKKPWYMIYADDWPVVSTLDKEFAKKEYTRIIEAAKKGYPITRTLAQETITPKP